MPLPPTPEPAEPGDARPPITYKRRQVTHWNPSPTLTPPLALPCTLHPAPAPAPHPPLTLTHPHPDPHPPLTLHPTPRPNPQPCRCIGQASKSDDARTLKPVDTAAALGSGSAPLPSLPQPRPRAPRSSWAAAPAASKPPASPPVALPRLRICAPTRYRYVADGATPYRGASARTTCVGLGRAVPRPLRRARRAPSDPDPNLVGPDP